MGRSQLVVVVGSSSKETNEVGSGSVGGLGLEMVGDD